MCNVLEQPGVHTIKELIENADFDPMLKLPNPPCFAIICLTDLLSVSD